MSTIHSPVLFDVDLSWLSDTNGVISSKKIERTIQVGTPFEFGGSENSWTPEHLLLGAISGCFMTTFLVFVKKFKFNIHHMDCCATGKVELINGKLGFSAIDLYPRIYITDEKMREQAKLAVEKAHKYCLVGNSISLVIKYHDEIIAAAPPVKGDDARQTLTCAQILAALE